MRQIVTDYLKTPSKKLFNQLTTMEQKWVKGQALPPPKKAKADGAKVEKKLTGIG